MNIKNDIESWPHKWYGIWKEYGDDYIEYYSIKDFISKEIVQDYQLDGITDYLNNSQLIASTSRDCFPDPITGEIYSGSISYRTDGVWLWLDDLSEYIKKYNVILPKAFLKNIIKNKYNPVVWNGNPENLDWPDI